MLAREDQLLLLLARTTLSSRLQEQARALLAGPIDWEAIFDRVQAEEIYPLFYRNLAELMSREQAAKRKEQSAESREQGAGSGEPEVGDQKSAGREQTAESAEQGAKGEEQCGIRVDSVDASVALSRQTQNAKNTIDATNAEREELSEERREQGVGSGEPEVSGRWSEVREQTAESAEQGALSEEQCGIRVDSVDASVALSRHPKNTVNAGNAINATDATNAERGAEQPPAPSSLLAAPCSLLSDHREQVLERLAILAKVNAFRNAFLVDELARLLKLFSDAGIPAIPLKGVTLAQSLYGDPALRVCVDLDILVPRSLVGRAFDLLRAQGYASEFGPGFFADLLLRHDIEYALHRQERGCEFMVELHWGVMWGGQLEASVTDRLWADASPTTVFGAPAYALSAQWQMLFLAAHAARHQWQGLKWLVDLHELFSSPDLDWDKLDRQAKQLGWQDVLRISLLACHALFATPVPADVSLGALPAWVKLFPASAPANLSGAFFATRFLQRPIDKLRYVARVLLVPTLAEWRLVQMPSCLGFLYYPLRPLRLLCKWSGAALAAASAQSAKG